MLNKRPRSKEELIEKFKALLIVDKNDCHIFTGSTDENGYGRITFQYKKHIAHRFSYEIQNGEIPKGMLVCHKCDNPPCVNPGHLFLGTELDNNMDKIKKGRDHNKSKTHCKNGHEFTPDNTGIDRQSKRRCKTCDRINHRKRSATNREYRWKENS